MISVSDLFTPHKAAIMLMPAGAIIMALGMLLFIPSRRELLGVLTMIAGAITIMVGRTITSIEEAYAKTEALAKRLTEETGVEITHTTSNLVRMRQPTPCSYRHDGVDEPGMVYVDANGKAMIYDQHGNIIPAREREA